MTAAAAAVAAMAAVMQSRRYGSADGVAGFDRVVDGIAEWAGEPPETPGPV